MKTTRWTAALLVILVIHSLPGLAKGKTLGIAQGMFAGELTSQSVILQSRLTEGARELNGEVNGASGVARFEVSRSTEFKPSIKTDWLNAKKYDDYIVKTLVDKLKPNTRYYYRLIYGQSKSNLKASETYQFITHAGAALSRPVSFTALTCMSYEMFHFGQNGRVLPYSGADKVEGFPALSYIPWMNSDFVIYNGDNVYYDKNTAGAAKASTLRDMRFRWHRQYSQPRLINIQKKSAGYWLKDDHDFRFNDSDMEGDKAPLPAVGIRVFNEQVPVVDPKEKNPVTYRTHRVSKELQLWFVENRDYRSPNKMAGGPNKTIWGRKQTTWLKRTLSESDANFKVIITPTPMVGPDRKSKNDNHTNLRGFKYEGEQFMKWLFDNNFSSDEVLWITGDRHWQYHSIHPTGFEEFSSGSLSYANSQAPIAPGSNKSTDPQGLIKQPFLNKSMLGGFLKVDVQPAVAKGEKAQLKVAFIDAWGRQVYQVTKHR
jgi:alkaline phosphatase D